MCQECVSVTVGVYLSDKCPSVPVAPSAMSITPNLYCPFILSSSSSSTAFLDRVDVLQPSHIAKALKRGYLEQRGVLRTNCIDCLDRTNVGQFAVGMRFLGASLKVL